jgi:hypothetical protein
MKKTRLLQERAKRSAETRICLRREEVNAIEPTRICLRREEENVIKPPMMIYLRPVGSINISPHRRRTCPPRVEGNHSNHRKKTCPHLVGVNKMHRKTCRHRVVVGARICPLLGGGRVSRMTSRLPKAKR